VYATIVVVADGNPDPIRERLIFLIELAINCQTHTLLNPIRRLNAELRTPLGH
jgi:hypothetical protein